jgi:hypothetical protein
MNFLLKWQCEVCHLGQETKIGPGDKWPHICDVCNTNAKLAHERKMKLHALQPTASDPAASTGRSGAE